MDTCFLKAAPCGDFLQVATPGVRPEAGQRWADSGPRGPVGALPGQSQGEEFPLWSLSSGSSEGCAFRGAHSVGDLCDTQATETKVQTLLAPSRLQGPEGL